MGRRCAHVQREKMVQAVKLLPSIRVSVRFGSQRRHRLSWGFRQSLQANNGASPQIRSHTLLSTSHLNRFYARSQNCEKRLLASSCLSVLTEQLGSHRMDLNKIRYLTILSKIYQENSNFIKISQEQRALCMKAYGQFCQYFAEFFLEPAMFQTKVLENIKTHFMFSIFFFRKSCRLLMWKNTAESDWPLMTIWRMSFAW